MLTAIHLVDDSALGGVMVALKNFEDPRLAANIAGETLEVSTRRTVAPALKADIIFIHFTVSWAKLPFLASLRGRNLQARIILIEHSYTEGFCHHNVPDMRRFSAMLRLSYGLVDTVVAVSRAQGHWMRSLRLSGNIVDIPQSRPLADLARSVPLARRGTGRTVFGAIGRFHAQKGFDDLIMAFNHSRLADHELIIGGYGDDEDKLRSLAQGNPNIRFLGRIADPAWFYAKSDCIVIPSRWEAFGLVASEAMAAGRYVLVTRTDGLTEQVIGTGHRLVPADSVDALRNALVEVAEMPEEARHQIAALTRSAAIARYDAMIWNWYELLLPKGGTTHPAHGRVCMEK